MKLEGRWGTGTIYLSRFGDAGIARGREAGWEAFGERHVNVDP